jgi:hypothetical protein
VVRDVFFLLHTFIFFSFKNNNTGTPYIPVRFSNKIQHSGFIADFFYSIQKRGAENEEQQKRGKFERKKKKDKGNIKVKKVK